MGISEATFYRWKQLYGNLMPSEVKKPNQVWAMDWMHDELFDGRGLWVHTVVDTWCRVCPVMRVRRSATAMEVIEADLLASTSRTRSNRTSRASCCRKVASRSAVARPSRVRQVEPL